MKRRLINKLLTVTIILSMMTALAACGNKAVNAGIADVETVEEETETEPSDAEETDDSEDRMPERDGFSGMQDDITEDESETEETAEADNDTGSGLLVLNPVEDTESTGDHRVVTTQPDTAYTYTDMTATMYAKQSVNVRDLPSTDGDRVGGLSTNQEVKVTGRCNETGWYRIEYNGSTAYVSNSYLSDSQVEIPTPAEPVVTEESTPASTETAPATDKTTEYINRMLELVNAERAEAGLSALTLDATLNEIAAIRAVEITTKFSHTRPDGTGIDALLSDYGLNPDSLYRGENIASGTISNADGAFRIWMNSDGHKANILKAEYNKMGVGYYRDPGTGYTYWVQIFTS